MGINTLSERKINGDCKLKLRDDIFYNDLYSKNNKGYCVIGCEGNDSQLIIKIEKVNAFKAFLSKFDGNKTYDELLAESNQNEENFYNTVEMCYNKGLFDMHDEIQHFNEVERMSIKFLRHNFKDFPAQSQVVCNVITWIFRVLFSIAFVVFWVELINHYDIIRNFTITKTISYGDEKFGAIIGYLLINVLTCLMGIFHECGHLVVSLKNKGRPNYIAFVLFMGYMPMAYIKYRSVYALKKQKLLEVLFAGVIVNIFFFFAFGTIYLLSEDDLFKIIALANLRLGLMNLVPLSLTDGYFIFSILTRKPNLRYGFFKVWAHPKEIKNCSKGIIFIYILYALILIGFFNVEMVMFLNSVIKNFNGAGYLILIPINVIYIYIIHVINLKKVGMKKV